MLIPSEKLPVTLGNALDFILLLNGVTACKGAVQDISDVAQTAL